MSKAYIVGAFMTAFGKRPDISFKALTAEAYEGVLADAGLPDGAEIASTWFGNCGLQAVGQGSVRGQICLSPLVASGRFPVSVPVINVENACATGSTAFHGALTDIISGRAHVSLALGVEKLFNPNPSPQSLAGFMAGADMLDPERWQGYYREVGEALGHPFVLGSDRSPFMDTYAMQALWHMGAHGTTERQIAAVAAKSHNNGALNPKAQYRFPMTIEEVLADRAVTTPFTRAMCSPIGDGAAAVLVASESFVGALSGSQRMRSIAIRSSVLRTGTYRPPEALGVVAKAAAAALAEAGLTPDDIDVAEVHDATAFSEISKAEAIGFCPEGAGGPLAESGATGLNGRIPLNPSGGLVSKGHPVGATGLAMLSEIVEQLRGEAGARQVASARIGLVENGGGVLGFDEAVSALSILERVR
ncbi:MAG: thiolase family protein [Brevundimonas sp.]|jgi:acetyl-CoA acetyltransferase|nr:thiolase family protein [Brevundimonas sp.]